MHFLGAIIGGNDTSEAEDIIDPYSEYENVEEHIVMTRDEFLKTSREDDMRLADSEHEIQPDSPTETYKEAENRLALPEDKALRVYADMYGYGLDEDGNPTSEYNDLAFYDGYLFDGGWSELTKGLQGITCGEFLALAKDGDGGNARKVIDNITVVCTEEEVAGDYYRPVTDNRLDALLGENPDKRIWFADFHV